MVDSEVAFRATLKRKIVGGAPAGPNHALAEIQGRVGRLGHVRAVQARAQKERVRHADRAVWPRRPDQIRVVRALPAARAEPGLHTPRRCVRQGGYPALLARAKGAAARG